MDHEAALDEIFAEALPDADPSSHSQSTVPKSQLPAAAIPVADEDDVFDELERELASSSYTAAPAISNAATSSGSGVRTPMKPSLTGRLDDSLADQLDELLEITPLKKNTADAGFTSGQNGAATTPRPDIAVTDATAGPPGAPAGTSATGAGASTAAVPARTAAQAPVTPARPAALSSPLQVATAALDLPLPAALGQVLAGSTPWTAPHLEKLSTLLAAQPVDANAVAALCLQHRSVPPKHRSGVWTCILGAISPPAPPPSPAVIEKGSRDVTDVSAHDADGVDDDEFGGFEAAGAPGRVLSPQPKHTKSGHCGVADPAAQLARITTDVGKYMGLAAYGSSASSGGASAAGLLAPFVPVEALARVVQSFCTTRMVPYTPLLAALAAPLAWVAPDSATAFLLLYSWIQTFFPSYFSLSVEGWEKVQSVSGADGADAAGAHATGADGAADLLGLGSSASSAADNAPPSLPYGVGDVHGKALHSLVLYHEPDLACALDAACPGWWRTVASVNTSSAMSGHDGLQGTLSVSSPHLVGSVPVSWFGSLFAGAPGVKPTALLPLWDRLLLAAHGLTVKQAQPGVTTPSRANVSMDVQSWPLTPAGSAVVSLAAALVVRESVSLRVVCRTAGVGSGATASGASASTGTGGSSLSVKERIQELQSGGGSSSTTAGGGGGKDSHHLPSTGPNQARALMASSLEGAVKRMLKAVSTASEGGKQKGKDKDSDKDTKDTKDKDGSSVAGGSIGGTTSPAAAGLGAEDEFLSSTATWLSSAASLLSATPQSFGVEVAAGVDFTMPTEPHTPTCTGALGLSPAEILPQIVYGWQRILAAVGAVPPSVRASVLQPQSRSALLPTTTLPIRPVHVMVIDVRPMSHRRAGRLATAYHIDANTVDVSGLTWELPAGRSTAGKATPSSVSSTAGHFPPATRAEVESTEDEVAGSSGMTVLGSPTSTSKAGADVSSLPLRSPGAGSATSAGGGLESAGTSASADAEPVQPAVDPSIESAAWGVRGVPLATAMNELKPLNGRLHFVVCGVGTRAIRGAYPPTALRACADLDDARVAAVVSALTTNGFRWVSTLVGGFGAIHGGVRNKAMHAPPLLPALRPDGSYTSALNMLGNLQQGAAGGASTGAGDAAGTTGASAAAAAGAGTPPAPGPSAGSEAAGVYDISLFVPAEEALSSLKSCLVDHAPRACPSCRHAAVARLFDRTLALAAQQAAAGAGSGAGPLSSPGAAPMTSLAAFLGGAAPSHGQGTSTSLASGPVLPSSLTGLARTAASVLDGLADSAAAAMQSLRDDLGVQPVMLQLPTLHLPVGLPSNGSGPLSAAVDSPGTPGGAAAAGGSGTTATGFFGSPQAAGPAGAAAAAQRPVLPPTLAAATDAALNNILAVVRAGGVTARTGLAAIAQDIAIAAEKAKEGLANAADKNKGGDAGKAGATSTPGAAAGGAQKRSGQASRASRGVEGTPTDRVLFSPASDAFSIGDEDEDKEGGDNVGVSFATPQSTGAGRRSGRRPAGSPDSTGADGTGEDGHDQVGEDEFEGDEDEDDDAEAAIGQDGESRRQKRIEKMKRLRDQAAAKARERAARATEQAKEQAAKARETATAAAHSAKNVIAKALAPPPAMNPSAAAALPSIPTGVAVQQSMQQVAGNAQALLTGATGNAQALLTGATGTSVATQLTAVGKTLKAAVAAPPPGSPAGATGGPTASTAGAGTAAAKPAAPATAAAGQGSSSAPTAGTTAPAAPAASTGFGRGFGGFSSLAGGLAGLSGKAAESLKQVQAGVQTVTATAAAQAERAVALAQEKAKEASIAAAAATATAQAQAKAAAAAATAAAAAGSSTASAGKAHGSSAPAPAPAPVVMLPVMDSMSARLLAGTAKGETIDITKPRWAATGVVSSGGAATEGTGVSQPSQGSLGLMLWRCTKEKGGNASGADPTDLLGLGAPGPDAEPLRYLPRFLCLVPSAGRLLVLEPDNTGPYMAEGRPARYVVKSNHHVTELGKLSYSRKKPNRVTLWYRRATARATGASSSSEGSEGSGAAAGVAAAAGTVELVPRCYVLEGGETRPDGSLVPAGEAFASSLQATVAKVKSGM